MVTAQAVALKDSIKGENRMVRKGFKMFLNPGMVEEYEKRHNELWPEMKEMTYQYGGHNCNIFLDREVNMLYGYLEVKDEELWAKSVDTLINRRWWDYMVGITGTRADNGPVCVDFAPAFHLSQQLTDIWVRLDDEKKRAMNIQEGYESTKGVYARLGVDVDAAVERLKNVFISMHRWQGNDVIGFRGVDSLSGGIQTAGNYPGEVRNPRGLIADIDRALGLIPGKHRIDLHASCVIFTDGEKADCDTLKPRHPTEWVGFARKRGLGLDSSPTMFSHPKVRNVTLFSEDPETEKFWIDHCKTRVRTPQYFAEELGSPCSMNIRIPDDSRDIPADRTSPGTRLKDSLDQIPAMGHDKSRVLIAVESKVFDIGMESYTVGSHEFCMSYVTAREIMCLLDSGHFHSTEVISNEMSSMLLFSDKVALCIGRPMHWDSGYVVLFDDEIREVVKEIVRNDLDRVLLALGLSDASINRICAQVVGMRNIQKALLYALLIPNEKPAKPQEEYRFTELMIEQEEFKTYPLGDVWNYFCQIDRVSVREQWLKETEAYEEEVLLKRGRYGLRNRGRLIPVA